MPRLARAVAAAWIVSLALVVIVFATFIAGLPLWIRSTNPDIPRPEQAAGQVQAPIVTT